MFNININSKYIIYIVIVLFLFILGQLYYNKYKEAERFKNNMVAAIGQTKIYSDKYNVVVAERDAIELSKLELKKTTDSSIVVLLNKNKELGIKLRKTEDLLKIASEVRIQTVVKIKTDTIFKVDTFYVVRKDSIVLPTFSLYRYENQNDESKYDINYTPDIYVSVNWYKPCCWKPRNIIIWREKQYKVNVTSNDTIFKPKSINYIKVH